MTKIRTLVGLVAAVLLVTAASTRSMAYSNIIRLGTYWTTSTNYDTARGQKIGGEIRIYRDSTDTLLVGDVVFLSRNNTVRKSATLANYNTVVGVVVGGTRTNMTAARDSINVGDTACLSTAPRCHVLVLVSGRTWIMPDSGLSPGAQLLPSTATAGRAHARIAASVLDTFYRAFGQLVDSGVSGVPSLANIRTRY